MATRLYLAWDTAAAVSPTPHSSWSRTTDMVRRKMTDTKGSTTLTNATLISVPGFTATLERQYVSTRMAAGVTFAASTTVSFPLQIEKDASGTTVNNFAVALRIVSSDGSTFQYGGAVTAFANTYQTTMTETDILNATATFGSPDYTTVAGDRIVMEFGHYDTNAGSPGKAGSRWGENGTDLTLGSGSTSTTVNPWIEFSNAITFIGELATPTLEWMPLSETIEGTPWIAVPTGMIPPEG